MKETKQRTDEQTSPAIAVSPARKTYQKPTLVDVFALEALATTCTGTNAKSDTALGCNAGALSS